jgi:hypothetical protein
MAASLCLVLAACGGGGGAGAEPSSPGSVLAPVSPPSGSAGSPSGAAATPSTPSPGASIGQPVPSAPPSTGAEAQPPSAVVADPAPAAPAAPATPPAPVRITLSGTAATGAAMVGARVKVVDSRGRAVGDSPPVGADGRFAVQLAEGATAPFVLEAVLADGESQVSILDAVQGETATINVTPITSLVAARLSPNGTPQGLVARFEQAAAPAPSVAPPPMPSPSQIQATVQEVLTVIAPVRQALGDTTDPIKGSFAVGGTGHDKVLDSIAVTVTPKSEVSSNIEVTVRTKRDSQTPLPAVSFASNAPAQQLPQVDNSLRRENFGAEGTSAKIDALVAELNGCYALPARDKVISTTVTPRTAALVKDGPCKTMYYDANPAVFLDNGAVVGNGAGGALFGDDVLVFDRPVYEYTRAEVRNQTPEMVVVTMRWTNQTTLASDTFVVHLREDSQGRLKLYGNQYRYSMSVRPIVLKQTYIRPDSGHMDNLRVGYNLLVPNLQSAGLPVFDRVEVEAPVGLERSVTRDVFVLRPVVGFSNLRMTGQFLDSRTSNVVWMGGGWVNPTAAANTETTSGARVTHPIETDGGGAVWINDPQGRGWSDDRLERLSNKSVWTFRYFLRGNTSNVPDAEQSMTTISRAPSISEARQQRFAEFTPSTVDWMRSMSMDPRFNHFWMSVRPNLTGSGSGALPTDEPPAIALRWSRPIGAVAPTSVNAFGRTTTTYTIPWEQRTAFDRLKAVGSTQASTTLECLTANATLRAVLCHNSGQSDRFSNMTDITEFELWGKDARQVEYTHVYATYIPATRRTNANPVNSRLNARP